MKDIIKNYIKFLLLSVAIAACQGEEDYEPGTPKPGTNPYTTVTKTRIINASPGAKLNAVASPVVQFAFNNILQLEDQKKAQSELNPPVEVEYVLGTSYRDILATSAAQVRFLNKADGKTLSVLTANYLQGRNYTTFLIDSSTRVAGMRALQFEDNLAAPAAGGVKIRFFHLAPNAPRVVVTNPGDGDAIVFTPRTFAQTQTGTGSNLVRFQDYTTKLAGSYTFDIKNDTAEGKPIILTIEDISLQAGKIYTFYLRGFVGGTGDQELAVSIIQHN
jgi:hypothetical protein